MNYAIAIVFWWIVGGLINFVLSLIAIEMTRENGKATGLGFSFIIFSFLRQYAVLLGISFLLDIPAPHPVFLTVCIVDILFNLLRSSLFGARYGMESWQARMKCGQTIGSVLFLLYYLIRLCKILSF